MVSVCAAARSTSARCRSTSRAAIRSISSRSQRRTSVATWSLRERPVCRRLPASPASSIRRASMLRWTSSRSTLPVELAALDLLADRRQAALDRGQVGGRDDLDVGEHRRVGEAAGDVGAPQPLVEGHARRVAFHELAHRLGKQRRPGLGFFLELVSGHGWRQAPGAGQACASHGLLAASPQHAPRPGVGWRQCPACAMPGFARFYRRRLVVDELSVRPPEGELLPLGGTARSA